MTDTFGDVSDPELLDHVKAGNNVVFNRIISMLSKQLRQAQDSQGGWQDDSPEAKEFRTEIAELHRLLEGCLVEGRKGRVSFETVDVGANPLKEAQKEKWRRSFQVRRDHPTRIAVTLEISGLFLLTIPTHDRRMLEDNPTFQVLKVDQRATLLALFDSVAPRRVVSVIAPHGTPNVLRYGDTTFVSDSHKVFSALIDVIYSLRNALFHGAITPNDTHNEIYRPAYRILMRLVRCTV